MWRRRRLCAQSRRCLLLSTRRAVARRPRGVGRVPRLRPGSRAGPGRGPIRSPLGGRWVVTAVAVEQCRVAGSVWTAVRGLDPGLKRAATDGGRGPFRGRKASRDRMQADAAHRGESVPVPRRMFLLRDFHLHEKQQQLVPVMPRGASRTLGTTATKLPGPGAAGGGWPCASRPEPGTELKSAAPRAGLGAEDGCPRPLLKLLDSEDLLISSEIVANFVSYFV